MSMNYEFKATDFAMTSFSKIDLVEKMKLNSIKISFQNDHHGGCVSKLDHAKTSFTADNFLKIK